MNGVEQHPTPIVPMASDTLVNISSGNGLAPNRHQAITWTNANLLLILLKGIHFNEILN